MQYVHNTGTRVATLSGAVFTMEAGVPRELPDSLIPYALGAGAYAIGDKGERIAQPAAPEPEPGPNKFDLVVQAMKDIIEKAQPGDFRQDGQPKSSILNRLVGETVLEADRQAAWDIATAKPTT